MDESVELKPGDTLANYEIVSFIGRGGMGEVYLARDRRLNRKVALKFLPVSYLQDTERLRRFQHEALITSALNHPNILTVHEIGAEGGRHFIVTEFVDGDSLRLRLWNGPLKIPDALNIAEQIASALAAAHNEGVIHRDIKPDNLMLRRDGIVKVLDFGLAKLSEPETVTATSFPSEDPTRMQLRTTPGMVMGTVQYMSPEQARGLSVDSRTDLWSLGVVLYEMLTARVPFPGDTTGDVIVSVLDREPKPLTESSGSELHRVQRLINKALTKEAAHRYQSAVELIEDIRRLREELKRTATDQAATLVAPSENLERVRSETPAAGSSQNGHSDRTSSSFTRTRVIASVIGLLLLLLLTVYSWTRLGTTNKPTPTIDSLAVLPLVNASDDPSNEYLSDGITESLINSLANLNLKVISRNTVFRYKSKTVDAQAVAKQLGVRGVLTGNVRQVGEQLVINVEFIDSQDGSVILTNQYIRKPSDLLVLQSSIAQDVAEKLRVKLSATDRERLSRWPTNSPEAYQLFLQGTAYMNKATPEAIHEAINYYQKAVNLDASYALAYSQMAQAYLILGIYFERPKEMMPNARLYCEKALELDSSLIDAHITMGMINLVYDWDFDKAERELVSNEGLNPKAIETFSCSAHILEATGKGQDAVKEIRRALALDPLSVPVNTELGCTAYYARQFDLSIKENQETLQLDPTNPIAYWGLARAFGQRGMYQQALDELKKVETLGGPVPPIILAEKGYALAAAGRKKEALLTISELDNLSKQVFVDPYLVACIYAGLGDKEKALGELEKALEIRSSFATSMKSEPKFDNIRMEPRFVSMMQQVGFKS